jgi:uncharacterized protein YjiS (DUF1127 family)
MKTLARPGTDRFSAAYLRPLSTPPLWASLGAAIDDAAAILFAWRERARQRRELLALNDRELHDIGLSRADAVGEGDKPFWSA